MYSCLLRDIETTNFHVPMLVLGAKTMNFYVLVRGLGHQNIQVSCAQTWLGLENAEVSCDIYPKIMILKFPRKKTCAKIGCVKKSSVAVSTKKSALGRQNYKV